MKKRLFAVLLAAAMIISTFAACGDVSVTVDNGGAAEAEDAGEEAEAEAEEAGSAEWIPADSLEDDPLPGEVGGKAFGKFDEPVDVHFALQVDPTDTTLPDGDAVDNNQYTRYLLENFNINFVCDWTAGNSADFQQKLSLCIASDSLPDVLVAPNRNYLVQAARADELADMWDVFNEYASKQVKQIVETTEGRAIANCTVDGTFCALPNITVDTDGVHIYFIRQDWLDQCGLEVPKTVEELGAAAQAFMDAGLSPDYAIAGIDAGGRTYCNFLNSSNNGYGFDAVYQAFNATPGYFLRDENNELYWGTTTDATKEALTVLNQWYEAGLINPEIGLTTNGDNANGVKNGTCGIWMGPWWGLGYGNGDSFKNDNTANWQAYPLYTADGEWNVHMKDVGVTYEIVSANASEDVKKAIVIANNVLVRDESVLDTSLAIGWYPVRNVMAAADETEYEYEKLMGLLRGEYTIEDFQEGGKEYAPLYKLLASDAAQIYDVISKDYNPDERLNVTDMDVNTNNGEFNRFYAIFIGDRPFATVPIDNKIYSELYYTIDGMDAYWTQVSDLEDTNILKFITGQRSLDEWDAFCEEWHTQGGDEILKLVDEFLK